MNYTDKEISDLIEESQWQIDRFERPSAHNSKLMINVIKHLQNQAKNNDVLDIVSYQRELFNSFIKWVDYEFDQGEYTEEVKQHVEDYLKTIT